MKKVVVWTTIIVLALVMFGCLSAERKEYTWNIKSDGSGNGKIVWRGLFSTGNTEDQDATADDFVSLINDYLDGTTLEDENPGYTNIKKRLFVERGKLCGEMTFEFNSLSDIGFYQYHGEGPVMFLLNAADETFIETNGDWAGEEFPVIFWPDDKKEYTLVTTLGDPDDEGARPLMVHYKTWEKDGTLPEIEESEYYEEEEYDDDSPADKIKKATED